MRIVALDLIRFFAALSVVAYHYLLHASSDVFPLARQITQYGYLGVPLFFMISGYVIALSADNRSPLQFAVSRFVRLYPALWAGAGVTLATTWLLADQKYSLNQILANFTLLNDYLGFKDIDGVYWTLHAELKFYGCVLLLLLLGVFHRIKIWLTLWLALTVIHSLWGQPFFMGWFINPTYSCFFIAGVAFYYIQKQGPGIYSHLILLVSLVVASIEGYRQSNNFLLTPNINERLIAVAIIWAFYVLLYLLSTHRLQLKERNIWITLGALTYPLYLIHNMAGKAIILKLNEYISEQFAIVLTGLVMLVIAWLIHRLIERPLATPLKHFLLKLCKSPNTIFRKSASTTD